MRDKYYTPCNVGIYIGGYRLSDAFRVDWDARDSKTPLYGWADDTFSAVSNGRKIITGRLVINYKYPGYLATAISEFTRNQNPIDDRKEVNEMQEFFSLDGIGRVKWLAQVAAKDYGDNRLGSSSNWSGGSIKFEGGPMREFSSALEAYKQKRTFDILVTYGDIMMEEHIETTIKDVYIVGQSQVISASATGGGDVSSSGSPIYEVYSFFAKEVLENLVGQRKMSDSTLEEDVFSRKAAAFLNQ
jgi:hypothetical protein